MIKVHVHSLLFPTMRDSIEVSRGPITRILTDIGLEESTWPCLTIMVDGTPIGAELWPSTHIQDGSLVNIGVLPALDSATTRNEILRTAVYTLFAAGGQAIGGTVGGVIGGVLGAWIGQLIPVPTAKLEETSYSINGVRNDIRKYEAIPKVFGRHRIYPPLAAQVATQILGDEQYANLLFCCGYKPLILSQFKIGEQDAASYGRTKFEINSRLINSNEPWPFSLYPYDVFEEVIDKDLEYCDDWVNNAAPAVRKPTHPNVVEFRTQPDTTRVSIDFVFPDGLGIKDGDAWNGCRVNVMVRYKPVGASETKEDGRSGWVYVVPDWSEDILRSVTWSESIIIDILNASADELENQIDNLAELAVIDREISRSLYTLGSTNISRLMDQVAAITNDPQTELTVSQALAYGNLYDVLRAASRELEASAIILEETVEQLTKINQILTFIIELAELIEAFVNVNEYMRLGIGPALDSLPLYQRAIIAYRQAEYLFGPPPDGAFVLTNMGLHQGTLRTNCTWPVGKGQYDVQIRRVSVSARIVNQDRNQWWDVLNWVDNPEGINENVIDSLKVMAVRSVRDTVRPVSARALSQYQMVATQLMATELLNGSLDQFNCLAEAPIPWHNGTAWQPRALVDDTGAMVYRNPAWAYCETLRGAGAKIPVSDTYIDIPRIMEWAEYCNDNEFYFDAVYDKYKPVEQVLDDICRVGKATKTKRDGKYSVVFDHEHVTPRAIISSRTSANPSGQKSFAESPNALRIRFVDEDNGYQESEMLVYDDGYGPSSSIRTVYDALFSGDVLKLQLPVSAFSITEVYDMENSVAISINDYRAVNTTADALTYIERVDGQNWGAGVRRWRVKALYRPIEPDIIDDVQIFGVTNSDHIHKLGRYMIACNQLRPEVFSRSMDWENIVFERGDMVEVQDDVTMWGYNSGRITAISMDGSDIASIEIDEEFTMVYGVLYQVKIRTRDNQILVSDIVTIPGTDTTITFSPSFDTGGYTVSVGDLVVFGEKDLVTRECVIKEIAMNSDLTAKVIFVEHAPDVHYSDQSTIPEFETGITHPPDPTVAQPPRPQVLSYMTDERALTRNPDGSLISRILVNLSLPSGTTPAEQMGASLVTHVELQYRHSIDDPNSAPMPWMSMPMFQYNLSQPYAAPVDDNHYYDIRIRSITSKGIASLWEYCGNIYIIGKKTPPPDVTEVRINRGIITWEYRNEPLDFSGFKVRVISGSGGTWESATPAHDGILKANSFDIKNYAGGLKSFFIKAIDVAGNESEKAATVITDLGDPPIENIVTEVDLKAYGFPGTLVNCEVDIYGNLAASSGSKTEFYRSPGLPFYIPNITGAPTTKAMYENAEFYTTFFQGGQYSLEIPIEAESAGANLYFDLVASGAPYKFEYREKDVSNFWPDNLSDKLWTADAGHSQWPDWQTWKAVTEKIRVTAGTTIEIRVVFEPDNMQFHISKFIGYMDVPDITETIEDFVVSDTGTVRLPITKTYTAIKSVQLTLQSSGSYVNAFTARILDKDPTLGPSLEVYDSSSIRTVGLIDAVVHGH